MIIFVVERVLHILFGNSKPFRFIKNQLMKRFDSVPGRDSARLSLWAHRFAELDDVRLPFRIGEVR